jgi:hypothetical protein
VTSDLKCVGKLVVARAHLLTGKKVQILAPEEEQLWLRMDASCIHARKFLRLVALLARYVT